MGILVVQYLPLANSNQFDAPNNVPRSAAVAPVMGDESFNSNYHGPHRPPTNIPTMSPESTDSLL